MASNKTVAAAFAAGLVGGGAGGDQLAQQEIDAANARLADTQAIVAQIDTQNPTIKSYIRYAAEQTITDVLDDRVPRIRANQLAELSQDIRADIQDGENVALSGLTQRLAEKVRIDDPNWLIWYSQNFANYLQSQIATGQAVGNLTPDQLVRLVDVVDVLDATAGLYIPSIDPLAEQSLKTSQQSLAEDAKLKGELLRARGKIE